jgi:hypothetical protein
VDGEEAPRSIATAAKYTKNGSGMGSPRRQRECAFGGSGSTLFVLFSARAS